MAYIKTIKVKNLLSNLPDCEGYLIAYSGGADSTALLHIFSKIPNIRAIHINHGLQNPADAWQEHCQITCDKLGIHLIVEQANLADASENSCRKARYHFFKKHLKANEILLTAHHSHDQAETVLLKLLRGTGISGLTGIDKLRKFSNGFIARPFLEYTPKQLKEYLTQNNISWIEDNSNQDNVYRRNYIRNEILPSLQSKFPQAIKNIARSANNAKQSLALLNQLCDFQGASLPTTKLKELPLNLQTTMLYHWLSQKAVPIPDANALKQITNDFIHAAQDKNPHYKNEFYQLYRSYGAIYCLENFELLDSKKEYRWNTSQAFNFPNGCGSLTCSNKKPLELTVKFNQVGQKLKPHNHKITKTVKNLFLEHTIPIWQKQNTPYIYLNNELISLGYDWSHSAKFAGLIDFNLTELDC